MQQTEKVGSFQCYIVEVMDSLKWWLLLRCELKCLPEVIANCGGSGRCNMCNEPHSEVHTSQFPCSITSDLFAGVCFILYTAILDHSIL